MNNSLKTEDLEIEDLEDDFYVEMSRRISKISEGTYTATIQNISLVRDVQTNYGGITKIRDMYWVTFGVNGSTVRKRYTKSVHEKSSLYKTIKALTREDPRNGYDVRHLIGRECLVTIVHKVDMRGNIWENVEAVMPSLS